MCHTNPRFVPLSYTRVSAPRSREQNEIAVSLHAEVDTPVFGLNWRPLVQLKIGARAGLQGLVDYVESITYLLFYLPTILLWLIAILRGAAAGWLILRWTAQHVFPSLRTSAPAKNSLVTSKP